MTPSTTSRNKRPNKILRVVIPLAFWLGVWQLGAAFMDWRTGGYGSLLLPAPLEVAGRLGALALQPAFWQAAGMSLGRIFAGFALGAALGTLAAVATAALAPADWVLTPAIKVVRAVPVASFIVLVLLWAPSTGVVPAIVSALMVLPVLWGNVSRGIAQTDGKLLEMARAYRFGRARTLRLVYLPSVLPYFASGCATALGLAWKAGVAAEVLCLPGLAIGTRLYRAKITMETPDLFAWTAVVIVLSFVLEYALGLLFRRMGGGNT